VRSGRSPLDLIDTGTTMGITNERRHHLYVKLEEVLGEREATTMMDHLPPVGWGDVATKADLRELGDVATKADLRSFGFDIRSEMHKGQRDLVFAMIGSNVSIAAVALAVASLL
jgi:hypothetical protein